MQATEGLKNIFLIIRWRKTSLFIQVPERAPVNEVKLMIEGITKVRPDDQKLFNEELEEIESGGTLDQFNITKLNAKAEKPFELGMSTRNWNGEFDPLAIIPYSKPQKLCEIVNPKNFNDTGGPSTSKR
ncbi:elongin-B-like [Teleopsis dalmanni]|uniref:elongin-B-like n=1 Tax=Teleopsis dalmanni TaxID=139649 RepID=UPI0018CCF665|nr:elongin-B-like [Teleopsis dalmanni]